jgi:S1-C subfamily serine protease
MRKLLSILLLFGLFALPVKASIDSWQDVSKAVQNAVVQIVTDDGKCTGFVVNKAAKYVQTAAHCYSDTKIWVDHVIATPIALDTDKDLMILEVKNLDPVKTELKLAAKNPEVMQDVMSVGYGYGFERPQSRAAKVSDVAMVIKDLSGPFIAVNVAFTPGQSGGPVVDDKGEVVSIVQRGDEGTLGLGVGAETIRERMGRFFGSK